MDFPKDVHLENCTCDLEKIAEIKSIATERKGSWVVDKDDNRLVYVDSFGWRGRYPGESNDCYHALIQKLRSQNSEPLD